MKLGIIAGLGMAATQHYRTYLSALARFEEIHVDYFLSCHHCDRCMLINNAAHALMEAGCTHAAMACFSYQEEGWEAIKEAGMTPVGDLQALLQWNMDLNKIQPPYNIVAHSRSHPYLRKTYPGATLPNVDKFLFSESGPARRGRRPLWRPWKKDTVVISACTDILCCNIPLRLSVAEIHVAHLKRHCEIASG